MIYLDVQEGVRQNATPWKCEFGTPFARRETLPDQTGVIPYFPTRLVGITAGSVFPIFPPHSPSYPTYQNACGILSHPLILAQKRGLCHAEFFEKPLAMADDRDIV
jgi:hypothetical protein